MAIFNHSGFWFFYKKKSHKKRNNYILFITITMTSKNQQQFRFFFLFSLCVLCIRQQKRLEKTRKGICEEELAHSSTVQPRL